MFAYGGMLWKVWDLGLCSAVVAGHWYQGNKAGMVGTEVQDDYYNVDEEMRLSPATFHIPDSWAKWHHRETSPQSDSDTASEYSEICTPGYKRQCIMNNKPKPVDSAWDNDWCPSNDQPLALPTPPWVPNPNVPLSVPHLDAQGPGPYNQHQPLSQTAHVWAPVWELPADYVPPAEQAWGPAHRTMPWAPMEQAPPSFADAQPHIWAMDQAECHFPPTQETYAEAMLEIDRQTMNNRQIAFASHAGYASSSTLTPTHPPPMNHTYGGYNATVTNQPYAMRPQAAPRALGSAFVPYSPTTPPVNQDGPFAAMYAMEKLGLAL